MSKPAVMWFRQDLRLADNAALRQAAESGPLICLYVLDDVTPGVWAWGGASRWWLHKSLVRLAESLARFKMPLILRRGAADKVIADVLRETGAVSLHFTRDYAPWAGALEKRIKDAAEARGVVCHRYGGFLLHGRPLRSLCNMYAVPRPARRASHPPPRPSGSVCRYRRRPA